MNEAQQKALAQAFELKGEGKTWAEVEKALEQEGFRDSRGNPYTGGNLKAWYSKLNGEASGIRKVKPKPGKAGKIDTTHPRERSDFLTRGEMNTILAEMEKRLRQLIETKLGTTRPASDISAAFPQVQEPPLPPKTGKKYAGTKADIRVRVDENLGKLFEADVNQRFGGNASRCMDAILWNFYGKPRLSFEE